MNTEAYRLELITPCFCGGAEPEKQAEIRAPSIRGQLRWWFRTLGGFKSLSQRGISCRSQEAIIFGSTAGDGQAGRLLVRINAASVKAEVCDGQKLGHANFSDTAYLTFPIQTREKNGQKVGYSGRGVLLEGNFVLQILWRGDATWWREIRALVAVFGHLGALGLRSRRAMGALAFSGGSSPESLQAALTKFSRPTDVSIKSLGTCARNEVIQKLGRWLKRWRAYGRSGKNSAEQTFPGFKFAKADHDHGAAVLSKSTKIEPAFRASLGLPIVQFFSSTNLTVNWEWDWNMQKKKGVGRFASPVLLRPHKDANGDWHALVIFVDAHQWPDDPKTGNPKHVFLNGQPRAVSLDLYNKMKVDPALKVFP